jgi:hypothetical protein
MELTGIRFSVVPDQQGECARTFHRKQSGAPGVQQTGTKRPMLAICFVINIDPRSVTYPPHYQGRNYHDRFKRGLEAANSKLHLMYNWKITGNGRDAQYYCASDVTKASVAEWFQYTEINPTQATITARVKVLRDSWINFKKNAAKHVGDMFQVRVMFYDVRESVNPRVPPGSQVVDC